MRSNCACIFALEYEEIAKAIVAKIDKPSSQAQFS